MPPESEQPWVEPESKPWHGPPPRTLPGRLADTLLLAHVDRVAVAVADLAAYPTGLTFSLQTIPRRYDPREWSRFDAFNMGPQGASGEPAPELLRFGVQFADGSRATSLDFARYAAAPDEPPQPPLLQPRGGGGGGRGLEPRRVGLAAPASRAIDVRLRVAGAGHRAHPPRHRRRTSTRSPNRSRLLWPDDGEPASVS